MSRAGTHRQHTESSPRRCESLSGIARAFGGVVKLGALVALCSRCSPVERAYEDASVRDARSGSAWDSAAITDASIDGEDNDARAPVVPLDRTVIDAHARDAARVFSVMLDCRWPPRRLSAQSLFLQFETGFDLAYQRLVGCALRSNTCAEYLACSNGGVSSTSEHCWGDWWSPTHSDGFLCGETSSGRTSCGVQGCLDAARCVAGSEFSVCDGEFATSCRFPLQTRHCPRIYPTLRCSQVAGYASCDLVDAPQCGEGRPWTCDGTSIVQCTVFPFGQVHSAAAQLPVARETRFDCARMGLTCVEGACVDPAGECSYDAVFDSWPMLDPATQSHKFCLAGRWYSHRIVQQ